MFNKCIALIKFINYLILKTFYSLIEMYIWCFFLNYGACKLTIYMAFVVVFKYVYMCACEQLYN